MRQEDNKWDRPSKLCIRLTLIEVLLLTPSTTLLTPLMRTINTFPTSIEPSQEILWAAITNLLTKTKQRTFISRAICFLWEHSLTFMRIPSIRCFCLSIMIVRASLVSNSCLSWKTRRSRIDLSILCFIWWEIRLILLISLPAASNSTKKNSTGRRLKSAKIIYSMKLSISLKEFYLSFSQSKTTVSTRTIAFCSTRLAIKDFSALFLRLIP